MTSVDYKGDYYYCTIHSGKSMAIIPPPPQSLKPQQYNFFVISLIMKLDFRVPRLIKESLKYHTYL